MEEEEEAKQLRAHKNLQRQNDKLMREHFADRSQAAWQAYQNGSRPRPHSSAGSIAIKEAKTGLSTQT